MKLSIQQIAMVFAGVVAYFALLYYVHRALRGRMQAITWRSQSPPASSSGPCRRKSRAMIWR
jgi:hypothetical protein